MVAPHSYHGINWVIGTYTGKYILHKIPDRMFGMLFKAMLTLLAIRLVYIAGLNLLPF